MGPLWTFVLLTMTVIVVLVGVSIVIAVSRVARRWSVEKASPLQLAEARVVDKRTQLEGGRHTPTEQRYYVTFEFADGTRLELDVPGPQSGLLVVGDQGDLEWRGPRYLGFTREILR